VPSRRDAVRRLGAALCGLPGLAGCLGTGGPGATTTDGGTGPTTGTTTAPSTTDRRRAVRFDHRDPSSLSAGTTTRLFTPSLARVLVAAARADGVVRTTAETYAPAPRPVLPAFDAVEIVGADDAGVDGTYALDVQAGTYYELLVGAEAVDPLDDATVRGVADLPLDRREFVRDVVGRATEVEPQTRRGEFVRNAFFGGYWRLDGTVYRGHEVKQTDAAFSSERAWYALSATPADREAPTLSVRPVPGAVHDALDEPLSDHRSGAVTYRDADPDGPVAAFARWTERTLLNDALLGVTLAS
jgi:hypothetical protein